MTRTPDDDLLEAVEDALVRSAYYVMGILTRIAAENDLSLSQLRVLGILWDRRLRMTDLAAHLGLDRSTLSGLVDRAERRGLLARGRSPVDRRGVDVFATPKGQALMAHLHTQLRAVLAPSIGHLTPERCVELVRLLEPILEAARRQGTRPPAGPAAPAFRHAADTCGEADPNTDTDGDAGAGPWPAPAHEILS